MKLGRWSTTAGNNNATPPDGWPEGQAPSTINDCARENMAAIRTAFNDLQYFDQDFTPTYISATSFSIPGNQTSAIHAGRRMKFYDANVLYGTVSTASFTTVTTIHVDTDAGNLTSSLSSFGVAILSVDNNALPRHANLTLSVLTVAGGMGVYGGLGVWSTLTVSATATFKSGVLMESTLSVSGTVVAANVCKAWVNFENSATSGDALKIVAGFNVAAVSFTTTDHIVRVTFTNALVDATYGYHISLYTQGSTGNPAPHSFSAATTSLLFRVYSAGSSTGAAPDYGMISVYR